MEYFLTKELAAIVNDGSLPLHFWLDSSRQSAKTQRGGCNLASLRLCVSQISQTAKIVMGTS
ncbi:MAG: hypothetical protein JXA14_08760, partial [Anaerolineae bacterium]|nr:hypothetical protein [Anaerolineae bacterium]